MKGSGTGFFSFLLLLFCFYNCLPSSWSQDSSSEGNEEPTQPTPGILQEIRLELLKKNYDKIVPPTFAVATAHLPDPTLVSISLTLMDFSLEETESTFYANVHLKMTWTDTRLAWPSNTTVNFVSDLLYGDEEIWKPDIVVKNSVRPRVIETYASSVLVVSPEGEVQWEVPMRLATFCQLDMRKWPFDSHTCAVKLASGSKNALFVDFQLAGNSFNERGNIEFENWIPNSEWTLIESNATRNVMTSASFPDPHVDVTFSFSIQRNSPSYVVATILPICLIAVVNTFLFLLPPTSGQKITLGSINFLISCRFSLYFESRLPNLGNHIPLLVHLYALNLLLVAVSLVVSVVVLNLSTSRRQCPPSKCLRRLCFNGQVLRILGLGHFQSYGQASQTPSQDRLHESMDMEMHSPLTRSEERRSGFLDLDLDDRVGNQNNAPCKRHVSLTETKRDHFSENSFEWIILASIVDRVSLIVYAVVTGVILGLCLA